jgi:hypothetical protein
MNFFDFFAVVEMGSISDIPASLFRHSLYLPHRGRTTKREGREAAITTVFVGEEGSRFIIKRKWWSSSVDGPTIQKEQRANGKYGDKKEERCLMYFLGILDL